MNSVESIKAPAREVKSICSTVPKTAFTEIINSAGSNTHKTQWLNVKRFWNQSCNTAQKIVVTPRPNVSLLKNIDPAWSRNIRDAVLPSGGRRKTYKRRKARKTRKTRRI
jgi:hypothetical protein